MSEHIRPKIYSVVVFIGLFWFLADLSLRKNALQAEEEATQTSKAEETAFPITYGQVCTFVKQKQPQIALKSVPEKNDIDAIRANKNACVHIELDNIPSTFEIQRLNLIPNLCVIMSVATPIKNHDLKRLPLIETSCALLETPTPPKSHEIGYLNRFKGCVNLALNKVPSDFETTRISNLARGCVVQQLQSPIKDQEIQRINKLPCLLTEMGNIPSSHEADILETLKPKDVSGNHCALMSAWRSRSLCLTPTS